MRKALAFISHLFIPTPDTHTKLHRTMLLCSISIALILLFHMGCGGGSGEAPPEETPDETPQWTCTTAPTSHILTADGTSGWMEMCDNTYYVQGPWDVVSDGVSTITDDWSGADSGEFCAQGALAEITDPDAQWGAAMTFYLCQTDGDETPPNEHFTISTCPWNGSLAIMDAFSGMTATIDGDISPGNEIRVIFQEAGRDESTYIVAGVTGTPVNFDFDDAVSPDGDPIDIDNIEAVVFQATASDTDDGTFDFCVSNISFY